MKLFKLIPALVFLSAIAFGQSSVGGGAALPAPGSAGLCLVSTSANAYSWGACSGVSATAFSALTPSANSTAGTYTMSGGANLSIGSGSSASATGTGTITATAAPWTGLTSFPTACTNKAVTGVGVTLTCTTLTSAYVDTSIALTGTDINTSNQVTVTHLAAALPLAQGGTSATTKSAAFDALSPMTTAGDIIYGGTAGTGTRLAAGTSSQLLHGGTTPSWSAVALATQVSGTLPLLNGGTGTAAASAAAAFDALAPTTTRGDLIVRGASSNGRVAIGTNGQCLTSDGTDATWGSCSTGSIGGTGTANTMTKFTSTSGVGDSLLTDNAITATYTGTGGLALTGGILKLTEAVAPTGSAGSAWIYADSTAHRLKAKNASNTAVQLVVSGVDINTSDQVTVTHLAAPLPTAQGGTGQNSTATFPTSGTIPVTGSCTNQAVTATTAGGVTCTTLTASYVDTTVAITGVDISSSSTVTVTHLATPLPSLQGGTASAFFTVAGPASSAKTYTFPNASSTVLTDNAAVTILQGGTGQTTKAAAFDALSPNTTQGDISYRGASVNVRLAPGTAVQVLHSGTTPSWSAVSLTADVSGTLPIANGGTANVTASAAFDALAPTTTQGDLILRGASSNARLAIGTNAQCLTSNGTTAVWGSCSTGSITGASLAATQVAVASSSSAITSYSTFTSDSSGNVTATSVSTTGGGVGGVIYYGQGTAPSLGTTAIGLVAGTAVTSYNAALPAAATSGYLKFSTTVNQTGCVATSTFMCGQFETAISLTSDVLGTLPVGNGGTGSSALTNHAVIVGNGSSPVTTLSVAAIGTVLYGQGAASDPAFASNPTLGSSTLGTGSLGIAGGTSGLVTMTVSAAAGTYNFNLPTTAGTAAQCLQSQGGGATAMTWGSCGSAPQLNTIVSAVAANTPLANGDNAQVWGWQQTTSGSSAFTIKESGAGTAGGTPYLLNIQTASASTVNPLVVTAGGTSNGIQVLKTTGALTSKGTGGISSGMLLCDATDFTKCAQFAWSGITTATTRAITAPDRDITLAGVTGTLTSGDMSNFDASGNLIASGKQASDVVVASSATTSNRVMLGGGSRAIKSAAGITTDGTSVLDLGVAGASVGGIVLANATSGTITLQPVTGALGTPTILIPAVTATMLGASNSDTTTTHVAHASATGFITTFSAIVAGDLPAALASSTSINGLNITASTGTFAVTNGKTVSVLKTLTFDGTDSTTMTFPSTSATIARTDAANTFTGNQTMTLASASVATTQSAKDNSTKIATTAYVDAATGLTTGTSVTLTAPRQYFVCTSTCTITVPVPAAGYEFCVMNDDNTATVITLSAIGSSARYENTARTAYGTAGTGTFISGGAAGDKVCLLGRDSTHYLTASFTGTWTAN